MKNNWNVYVVECKNSESYVGIAKDVQKRIALHNQGLACRYTKHRRPVKLRYKEPAESYSVARKREKELKGFSRNKKIALFKSALCENN